MCYIFMPPDADWLNDESRVYPITITHKNGVIYMKKVIACILLLLLVCSAGSVHAQEPTATVEDSLTVSDEIRAQIGAEPTDRVVKVYVSCSFDPFLYHDNEEGVVAVGMKNDAYIYVIYRSITDYNCFYYQKGSINPCPMDWVHSPTLQMCITGEIMQNIDPNVEIYRTYYFAGEDAHCFPTILFCTSAGDYVYCDYSDLLMPLSSYCVLQRVRLEEFQEAKQQYGSPVFHNVWDLSVYNYTSPNFDPDADIHTVLANSRIDTPAAPATPDPSTEETPNQFWWLWIAAGAGGLCVASVVIILICRRKK